MSDLNDPSEQLRVIRSLMERATIYRTLSAPTALVGGLLSLGAFGVNFAIARQRGADLSPDEFLVLWLSVLVLTGLTNGVVLWRGAVRRGDVFFSSGMKAGMASLAPAFLTAGVFTYSNPLPFSLCMTWPIFYGLGLLATQHFAPRSLVFLGGAFLVAGCGLALFWKYLPSATHQLPSSLEASGVMAATFGGIHLVYAAVVWLRGEERKAVEEA